MVTVTNSYKLAFLIIHLPVYFHWTPFIAWVHFYLSCSVSSEGGADNLQFVSDFQLASFLYCSSKKQKGVIKGLEKKSLNCIRLSF